MTRRRLAPLSTAVLLAAALSACGGGGGSSSVSEDCEPAHADLSTVTDGTLLVSTYVSPPYTELDRAGGELGGVDGEIIRALAEKECLEVKASPVTGAAFTEGVSTGRSDVVIGGVYATPERAEEFTLSSAMYRDGMAFLSEDGVSSIDDLEGKKLGVIQGYLWTEDLQDTLGTDSVVIFQDADSMIADLGVGRIDAATLTTAEAGYRAGQVDGLQAVEVEPDDRVAASTAPSDVVLLMAKDTKLAEAFDADIEELLADGTIAGILEDNGIDGGLAGSVD
ncbi:substrate-binding periplasmic protein [Nocardioides zeae]|uniref:Amino acid ABC transporter substrate-binding protein n=1 Tax=Nocardioides zeae TaxID=1457234 RepID=A0A6P0HPR9_9ACTN|nr:transporter substrate-binding domain-containing protein [Nocardioides zeae]NEN80641.1 amino acid ABC transporter substrate-binding protein [Nocardioides zeae]